MAAVPDGDAVKRVLVTRPADDAASLLAALAERGIEASLAPLLTIRFIDGAALNLTGVQALLMTSANGVRALARRSRERGLPVLAVGDATARAARELQFTDVVSAAGDVDGLAELALERLDPDGGALLHPAGSKVAGDLAGRLAEAGFDYRREVLYRAETPDALPPAAAAGLHAGSFDGVLLYSPRTGASFRRLVADAGLADSLARVSAYCLSANVAAEVASLPWARVLTAGRPEQAALLALFDEA